MTTRARWNGSVAVVVGLVAVLLAQAATAEVVYFVSGKTTDNGLKTHLANDLGHTVIARSGSAGTYADAVALGADLIILSGSISSSQASGRGYHTSDIPVINYEPFSFDDFGWTGTAAQVDFGDSADGKQNLQIEPIAHPITKGFSGPAAVSVPVYDTADGAFSFGNPAAAASVLATYQGPEAYGGSGTIFVYERGDALHHATGDNPAITTAQSRYIGVFVSDFGVSSSQDIYDEMNANGQQLFDQAVAHALDTRRAHWTFDSDMTDAVGDNDGTAVNGASITHASGESFVGKGALDLVRSSSQYVKVDPMAGELGTGDAMSVSLWFNTTYTGGPGNNSHQLFSAHKTDNYNVFRIGTTPAGGIFCNPSGLAADEKNAGAGYADGNWHLLTASLDGTNVRVTVDTQEVGAGAFTNSAGYPLWSNATKFSIGQEYDGGPSDFYNGQLDDVQVWGKVLTQGEIDAMYAKAYGPRAHWTFDNNFTDSVGDNHGTPHGGGGGASISKTTFNHLLGDGALSLVRSQSQYVSVDGLAGEMATGNDMTMTLWFNTTFTGGTGIQGHQLFSAHTSAHANLFRLGTTPTGGIFLNPGNTMATEKSAGSGFADGEWHFLTVSLAGLDVMVTVDGRVIGDGVFNTLAGNPDWSNAALFSFGQEWDGGASDFFDGYIDDVMLWGRALSLGEIRDLRAAGVPEPATMSLLGLGLLALARRRRR